jgi:hypothetical protein
MSSQSQSQILKRLESVVSSLVEEKIRECAKLYSFDAEEAILRMGLESRGVEKSKKVRSSSSSARVAMPFVKSNVSEGGCGGLEYNHGLFTQCCNARMDEGTYCEKCSKECEEKGEPLAGKLEVRLEKGLMEYRDPSGRKPVGYLNYLKKKNISVEIARGVAEEKGLNIEEHLVESDGKRGRPKKEESLTVSASVKGEKRGRPKKSPTKVEREEVVDLFASSIEEFTSAIEGSMSSSSETSSLSGEEESLVNESEVILSQDTGKRSKKESKKEVSEEEKQAKKLALEQEKLAKKQALEQEKEAKKLALEQEKEGKKLALEQEKEAKKQALIQEKEALELEKLAKKLALEQEKEAKKQEKLALEQEKLAKKQALEQEKEAKKKAQEEKASLKQSKTSKKREETAPAPVVEVAKKEEERPKVQVSEFTFEGVKYWRSTDNIMYDPDTKEVKGIWSETEKKMLPAPEESEDELSEEEYEDDEDEE